MHYRRKFVLLCEGRITHDESMEGVREHGVDSITDVNLAILEVDGNISILSSDFHRKTNRKRKLLKTAPVQLNYDVNSDERE